MSKGADRRRPSCLTCEPHLGQQHGRGDEFAQHRSACVPAGPRVCQGHWHGSDRAAEGAARVVNSLLGPLLMAAADLLLRGLPSRRPSTRLGASRPVHRRGPSRSSTSLAYVRHTPSLVREVRTVRPGPTTSSATTLIKASWASNLGKASTPTQCHNRRADCSKRTSAIARSRMNSPCECLALTLANP
jgi:hypothetical protein